MILKLIRSLSKHRREDTILSVPFPRSLFTNSSANIPPRRRSEERKFDYPTYLQNVFRLILAIELPATGADETCNTNATEISCLTINKEQLINNERQDSKTVALSAMTLPR